MATLAPEVVTTNGYAPPEGQAAPALAVAGLTVYYDGVLALDDISFRIRPGDRVAIAGPNGAGKSTLFKAITGLVKPTSGTIQVGGRDLARDTAIAYVPQRSQIDWTFPVNVWDVVMMGRVGKIGLLRWPGSRDRAAVRRCLDLVGMSHLARRQIGELSGGQQQRVFIARALAQEAALMLMDEPVSGLDMTSQHEILRIIAEVQQQGVTVLVATHDLNQAASRTHYEQVLLLNRRLMGYGLAQEVLTPERLAAAYSGQLRWIETANGRLVIADTCCSGGNEPL